jgi:tetratricopeptide (TPR) repeat protein
VVTSPAAAPLLIAARAAHDAGRYAEAETLYARAAELAPDDADVRHNRGAFFALVGRLPEAEAELRRAVELAPETARSRHALGFVLLRQGRYAEGWPLYEARHETPQIGTARPGLPYPQWRGEDLAGQGLLIFGEQGFGDQIMAARFAPWLAARGVDVTLLCNPLLTRLFAGLGVRVVGMSGSVEFPSPAAFVMSGDLAGRAGITRETIPGAPYLQAEPKAQGGLGVVARGNPSHMNDGNRSLPPELAERLLALPGALSLAPEDTGAADFQATADRIAGLDLVITVDTAVAHLAGAVGKPVWILIPRLMTDWRWGEAGDTTPWYPSARLYRQQTPGDWTGVIDRIEADYAKSSSERNK